MLSEVFHSHVTFYMSNVRAVHEGLFLSMRCSTKLDGLCNNLPQNRGSCGLVSASSNSNFGLVIRVFFELLKMLTESTRKCFSYFYVSLRGVVLNHFCTDKSRNPGTQMLSQGALKLSTQIQVHDLEKLKM